MGDRQQWSISESSSKGGWFKTHGKDWQDGSVVKEPATKSDDLGWIPETTWKKERTNSCTSPPESMIHAELPHMYTYA